MLAVWPGGEAGLMSGTDRSTGTARFGSGSNPVALARRAIGALDRWQRRNKPAGVAYAVVKKFGDDSANLIVVSLAWYGFTAIFPLLLVVVTVFGLVGQKSLGSGVVSTLHHFPVVGSSFNPASHSVLHASILGLIIGLVGLLYGAQGVTQSAEQAMAMVWNVPQLDRAGFVPRLLRSLLGLLVIGSAFLINAFITTYATGGTASYLIRVPVLIGLVVLNSVLYLAAFAALTSVPVPARKLMPGAVLAAVGFTALITVGTGLVTHQLKDASATYGAFGTVIGIVAFLLLLSKLTLYAAELNPVLARSLYPRALPLGGEPTHADRAHLADLVHEQRRRGDQVIGVGFGDDAADEAAADAAADSGGGPPASGEHPDTAGNTHTHTGRARRNRVRLIGALALGAAAVAARKALSDARHRR